MFGGIPEQWDAKAVIYGHFHGFEEMRLLYPWSICIENTRLHWEDLRKTTP